MNKLRNKVVLEALGNRVREIRQSKNITMMNLAFDADIEYKQVCRIEKGETNPTYSTLLAIAKGLEIPLTELLQGL